LGEDRYWLPIKPAIPLHVGAFWREEGGQNGLHGHVSPRNTRRLSVDRLSKKKAETEKAVQEKAQSRQQNRTRKRKEGIE